MRTDAPASVETALPRSVLGDPAEFEARRHLTIPFLFVLSSLAALLVVPPIVLRRVSTVRQRLEVAQEAHQRVDELELGFARIAAVVRAFLASPDPSLQIDFRRLVSQEQRQFDSLAILQTDLGIASEVSQLRSNAREWHSDQESLLAGTTSREEFARRHPPTRYVTEDLLAPADILADTIQTHIARYQDDVARTERWGTTAMVVLTLLAAASALIVASVARHFRLRGRQEQLLREAALLLTEAVHLPDVLRRIAISAARVDHARSAYVERVVNQDSDVEVVATVGELTPRSGLRLPWEHSATRIAVERGDPAIFDDLSRVSPFASSAGTDGRRFPGLVNLLRADGMVQGALVLVRGRPASYKRADVEQVRIFAVLASLALRSAVLLDDAERRHRELREVTESRARLIRGFSHDVKNPLAAADGYASLLETGIISDPHQIADSVRHIRETIGAALRLIDELVDLGRAEAGQLTIRPAPVRMLQLLRRTFEEFQGQAAASNHDLIDELPAHLPPLTTDADRVRQILANLLSNALKHTPRGTVVRVRAAVRTDHLNDGAREWVTVSIADSGPGIAPPAQHRLFHEFVRLHPDATPGAGLGLAVSQHIARGLGGEITLESQVGVGSTFTLWLPTERSASASSWSG